MSVTIKAYFEKGGTQDVEIRRFPVPADVSTSYAYLSKKIANIFPALREGHFSTFWKGKILFSNFKFLLSIFCQSI